MNTVTRVSLDSRSPTLSESNRCQAWPRTPVISAQAAAAGTLSSRTGAQNKTSTKAYGQPSPAVCSRSSCLTVAVFPLVLNCAHPHPKLQFPSSGKAVIPGAFPSHLDFLVHGTQITWEPLFMPHSHGMPTAERAVGIS